jgi:hypothetical protein
MRQVALKVRTLLWRWGVRYVPVRLKFRRVAEGFEPRPWYKRTLRWDR